MDGISRAVMGLVQAGILVALGPLVTGLVQKLKARLQCRRGASVWQPYRDLAKPPQGHGAERLATPFFRATGAALAHGDYHRDAARPLGAERSGASAARRLIPLSRPGLARFSRRGALDRLPPVSAPPAR
jgi:hypothetical protein